VDVTRSAVKNAKYIIGQVNPKIPRTFGDGTIHVSHLDCIVNVDEELPMRYPAKSSPIEIAIGRLIADNLVENGATLQMGIFSSNFLAVKLKNLSLILFISIT
jgi:acyl-CoA hydrolase